MILPIDKPSGVTSASCVRRLGRAAGSRAGHAGTLDPDATGLLVICLGEARKLTGLLAGHDKTYSATVQLGASTATLDASGEILDERPVPHLDVGTVERAARGFVGRIRQTVPGFSAVKRDGVPLHRLARRGQAVSPPERDVTIHSIDVRNVDGARIELEVSCAAGTYVRSLARDLALALGTVGHLASLRRLSCGPVGVEEAVGLEEALAEARSGDLGRRAIEPARALASHTLLVATDPDVRALRAGRSARLGSLAMMSSGVDPAVVLDAAHAVVCVAVIHGDEVRPRRVLL